MKALFNSKHLVEIEMNDDNLDDVVRLPLKQTKELFDKITADVLNAEEIWNAAIEAAANVANAKTGEESLTSIEIRRLKK